jgi:hypothetical protein
MKENKKNLVVGLSGGLGNQMFQYAAGRSLGVRLGVPIILDMSWFAGQAERRYALAPFGVEAEACLQFPLLPSSLQAITSRLSRRYFSRIMGVPVWRERCFNYTIDFDNISEPVYLDGYWQSERYFRDIRALLVKEFSLRQALPASCKKLLSEIRGCDAICVHVRRGDYISNPIAAKVHGTCTVPYYTAGVEELCEGLKQPHCYVFSDDPEWVRSSLSFNCPMTVVDLNGSNDAHLDLVLMASCKHFLIANSSLSWWGAWLGVGAEKKVIAPTRWFLGSDKDTRDLCPESWLLR